MEKRVPRVDMFAILGIFVILVVAILLELDKYLFRIPFVTLFVFYAIGKYARDYEIKLWNKKHGSSPDNQGT